MNGVGGRTQWYCPGCGRAVGVGGVCGYCGTGGLPEGPYEEQGWPFEGLRRRIGVWLGRAPERE
jgi:hypothetical protein